MPVTRELNPQELAAIDAQGLDSSQYRGKAITLLTDDDIAKQPNQQSAQPQSNDVSQLGAVGRTLEARGGGIIGGGISGLLGAEYLPFAHVAPPYSELIAGALGAVGGGLAGQKAQQAIVGPEKTQELEQAYQEAQQQHPITTAATDIGASALASGGMVSPTTTVKGLMGIGRGLLGKGLSDEAKQVLLQSVVNPAINSGVNLAATGQMPSIGELGEQAIGGALFPKSSAFGNLFHRQFSNAEPTPETTSKTDETTPTTPISNQEQNVPASPFQMKDSDGNYQIDDNNIKNMFMKQKAQEVLSGGQFKGMSEEDKYQAQIANAKARTFNSQLLKMPIDDMRSALHDDFVAKQSAINTEPPAEPIVKIPEVNNIAPETKQVTPVESGIATDANKEKPVDTTSTPPMSTKDGSNEAFLKSEQQRQETQQKLDDFNNAKAEEQRIKDAEVLRGVREQNEQQMLSGQQASGEPKPLSENSMRILNPSNLVGSDVARGESFDRNDYAPPSSNDDVTRYNEIQSQMKAKMQKGEIDDEFHKLWKQSEDIKNENGGNVPTENVYAPKGWGAVESEHPAKSINSSDVQKLIKETPHTVGSVLDSIASDPNSPYSEMAKQLKLDNTSRNVPVIIGNFKGNSEGKSFYNLQHDVVVLHPQHFGSDIIGLHEAIHAATSKKFKSLPDNHPIKQEILSAYNETKSALSKQELTKYQKYGLKNPNEYIAMALGNKEFQNKLNEIQTSKGTIWSRLADAIRRILGVDVKHGSMLERVLKPIDELTQMERPKDATTQRQNETNTSTEHTGVQSGKDLLTHSGEVRNQESKEASNRSSTEQSEEELIQKHVLDNWKYRKGEEFSLYISGETGKPRVYKTISPDNKYRDKVGLKQIIKERDSMLESLSKDNIQAKTDGLGIKIITEENLYAPPKDEIERTSANRGPLKFFGDTLSKIRDIAHPTANKLADAVQNTHQTEQSYVGRWANKVLDMGKNLTSTQESRLSSAMRYELETGNSAPATMFRTPEERAVFNQARKSMDEIGTEHIANKEPITLPNGTKRLMNKNDTHWATTANNQVVETIRKGTDTAKIDDYGKKFVDYNTKLGMKPEAAQTAWKEFQKAIQITANKNVDIANNQFYNAVRKMHSTYLPPEMTTPGFLANFDRYVKRASADMAAYKHIESNHEVMSSLGATKDAWGRDIKENPNGVIAGNPAVKAALNDIRGRIESSPNEGAVSNIATSLFLGPGTNIHKVVSNVSKAISNYANNPYEMGAVIKGMATKFSEGVEHSVENGVVKLTARSTKDFFNSQLSMAERMYALAQGVRKISSLGDLTEKWNAGLMQAGFEGLMPLKIASANRGNKSDQQLLKHIDTTYEVKKTYTDKEMQQLASNLASHITGTGDARTLPPWMLGDSEVSGFFKLAHWSVSQTSQFMHDIVGPAKNGNYIPLISSLVGAAAGGYIIKELREKLSGKKSQIPSLSEIASSEKGLSGNIPLLGYELMASAAYGGFGGMATIIGKAPLDKIYKNTSQGMAFPLDEISTDIASQIGHMTTAMANDPNFNWLRATTEFTKHLLTTNMQLGRIAFNQGVNNGLITGSPAEKKQLIDKMGELRRFQMVSGLPYEESDNSDFNPYMNLEQKRFKQTQDVGEAMKMLPGLLGNIIEKYHNNPDIMMQKMKALKQNSYATMPSLEDTPLSFMKYVGYLQREEGPQEAQAAMMDYFKHKMINEAKASVVP